MFQFSETGDEKKDRQENHHRDQEWGYEAMFSFALPIIVIGCFLQVMGMVF